MAPDPDRYEAVSRRKFIVGASAVGIAGVAGCSGDDDTDTEGGNGNGNGNGNGDTPTGTDMELSGEISITGSSTVFPISDAMGELFENDHPEVSVPRDSTGSGGGFENHFCPGDSDINGASRPIKDEEMSQCQDNGVEPIEFRIAGDALTMAVNNENDWVDCMTFDEMSQIWREDGASNWNEIRDDFPDEPLELFGPASTSGTYDWFLENVVNYDDQGLNHTAEHEPTEEDNLIVQGIEDNPGGMGYFGFAYYDSNSDRVKALSVRTTEEDECGAPGLEAASDGTYPMARPLFIYVNKESLQRPEVEQFLRFYFEKAGDASIIADEIGYVPSGDSLVDDNISKLEDNLE